LQSQADSTVSIHDRILKALAKVHSTLQAHQGKFG